MKDVVAKHENKRAAFISCDQARTLPGLFRERAQATPTTAAYLHYDRACDQWRTSTWGEMYREAGRWRQALAQLGLRAGDRIALLAPNSVEWVLCEQAALSLGLVVVPLYFSDNPGNIAFILGDSGAQALFVSTCEQWRNLGHYQAMFPELRWVLYQEGAPAEESDAQLLLYNMTELLAVTKENEWSAAGSGEELATIIYTSGTTGPPKGVMLSHRNILWNAEAVLQVITAHPEDLFLSFLPLSHALERTVGYYIPMMAGSTVAYARSVKELGEDLRALRPTILIAVPRIFDKIHARVTAQLRATPGLAGALLRRLLEWGLKDWAARAGEGEISPAARLIWRLSRPLLAGKVRKNFGGRLRIAVSGGAPLAREVAIFFAALGVPLLQGYGLTEAAPVVSANTLTDNAVTSVGRALPGVEVRLGPDDELLVRSPSVMLGYLHRRAATAAAVDGEGWLHTGDIATIEDGRIYLKGRLKDILVTSTGEKISPADLESAILQDPLIQYAMVVGEGRPYLLALLVLDATAWPAVAQELSLNPLDPAALQSPALRDRLLRTLSANTRAFPRAATIGAVLPTLTPWSIASGLLTATMKLKRGEIERHFRKEIEAIYAGSPPH